MKWFLAIALLAVSAGVQYWAIKRRSERVCYSAVELSAQAPRFSAWLREAKSDPFLEARVFQGTTGSLLLEAVQRARWISSDTSGSRLSPEAEKAFRQLSQARTELGDLASSLEAVGRIAPQLHCESEKRKGTEPQLHFRVMEASRVWEYEKKAAVVDRATFEQDRIIYCKGDDLIRGIQKVISAREARCKGEKLSAQLAAACKGGSGALEGEVADLEKQKDFNMRKLRQKWSEPVLKELHCRQSG